MVVSYEFDKRNMVLAALNVQRTNVKRKALDSEQRTTNG